VKNSGEFDFVDGSVNVRNQATVSTNLARSTRTSSGVTISNFDSNMNSTIVLTDRDNGEIVGYKSLSVQNMNSKDNLSLNTSNLGGKIGTYLIPNKKISINQSDIDTELSNQARESALDNGSAHIYLGTVGFEDQEYNVSNDSSFLVSNSEVRDTVGMNTAYTVSIHPITADNQIIYDRYIGYSDVFAGVNDDLRRYIRNSNGDMINFWLSN
jgi:hypothetical protein